MRVLITGGGGFIGSHLVEDQLAKGHQVRTIDMHIERLTAVAHHPSLDIVQASLSTDADFLATLVADVDVIYHLASAHLDVTLPDSHYYYVNLDVVSALLRAAHAASAHRFVHCSTNSVVGDIKAPPIDEGAPCRPTNIYESTKLAGEQAALAYHTETGFEVVMIRPSWVYGPRCPRTAKLFRTIGKGRFIMFGDGQTLRHPLHISDALAAFELAATQPGVVGEIYFVAGETAVTIDHLVREIAAVQGKPPPRLRLPLWLGHAAGFVAEMGFKLLGKQPPISRRTLDFYTKHNAYDISKARRELGFAPQVNLRAGLQQTLAAL